MSLLSMKKSKKGHKAQTLHQVNHKGPSFIRATSLISTATKNQEMSQVRAHTPKLIGEASTKRRKSSVTQKTAKDFYNKMKTSFYASKSDLVQILQSFTIK